MATGSTKAIFHKLPQLVTLESVWLLAQNSHFKQMNFAEENLPNNR